MNITKQISLIIFVVLIAINPNAFASDLKEKWSDMNKEDKLLYSNIGAALAITTWGIINWDYGKRSPHAESEGWFEEDTKSGGADKMGHLYTAYVASHGFSHLYQSWGYPKNKAALYGAWSSFGLLNFMEVGDSFSSTFGFSYEDLIMNSLGSYIGYVHNTNPRLARMLDLRIEYKPGKDSKGDIFTDYEHSKYLIALKLDGINSIRNKYLKYLELHVGYYTRGYKNINDKKERTIYYGIGINLSKIFSERSYKKTATFLKYYQVPYTDIQFDKNLN